MATVIDLLRSRGLHAGPGGTQALCGPVAIPHQPGRPTALAAPAAVVDVWTTVTGRHPVAGHAIALAANRTGETIAFMGHGTGPQHDLLLLMLAHLAADPTSVVLWLVPDARSARAAARLLDMLPPSAAISWQPARGRQRRPGPSHVVVASYDELHQRLLTGADRGWRWLWARVDLIVAPDLQRAPGALGAHLCWLLRRVDRLASRAIRIAAGVAPIFEPEEALGQMLGRVVRVTVSDASVGPALVALWRGDERWGSVRLLAAELLARRLPVTVIGRDEHETEALRGGLASLPAGVIDLPPDQARVAVVAGVPYDSDTRDALVHRGYRLIIMIAGDDPYETLCAEQLSVLVARPPALPVAAGSAYVAAAHLQWAACEAPLTLSELDRWDARVIARLLLERGLLRLVAGDQIQPGDAALDHGLGLIAATLDEPPFEIRGPGNEEVARLLPHVGDWWALGGTTWQPGWVVGEHADEAGSASLLPDPGPGIALPLIRFELSPRDETGPFPARVGARTVAITRARVHVKQRVEGHLVYRPDEPVRPVLLPRSCTRAWNAHACAIELPVAPDDPRVAGWALGLALPHIVRLAPGDALVTYDAATRAIWIVETHPGGAGLAACVADEVPQLLATALALAKAAIGSAVYGPLARSELSWLEPLYGEALTPNPSPTRGQESEMPLSASMQSEESDDTAVSLEQQALSSGPLAGEGPELRFIPPSPDLGEGPRVMAVSSNEDADEPDAGGFFEEVVLEDLATVPEPAAEPSRADEPDVQALIARMRRMREQREPRPARHAAPAVDPPAPELRFRRGQRVRCVPYGEGTVREARVVDGREHLTIDFPEAGAVEIDPAMSVLRVLDRPVERPEPWDPLIF